MSMDGSMSSVVDGESNVGIESGSNGVVCGDVVVVGTENVGMVELGGGDGGVEKSVGGEDKEGGDGDEEIVKGKVEVGVLCEGEMCGGDQEVDRSVSGKDKVERRDEDVDGCLVAFRVSCEMVKCGLDQEMREGYSNKSGEKEGEGDGESVGFEAVSHSEVAFQVSCEVERCGGDQEVDRSVSGMDMGMGEDNGLVTKSEVEYRVSCEAERCGIDQEFDRSVSGKDKEEDRDEGGDNCLVASRVSCEMERGGLDQEMTEGYSNKFGEKEGEEEGDGGSVGFGAVPNSEVAFQVSREGEGDGIDQEVIRSVRSKGKDIDMGEDGGLMGCERLSNCEVAFIASGERERCGIDQDVDRSINVKEEEEKGKEKEKEAGFVGIEEMANAEVRCSGEKDSLGENGDVGLVSSRLIASPSECAEQKEKLLVGRRLKFSEERGYVGGNGGTTLVLPMQLISSSICAHKKEEKEDLLFDRSENGTAVSEVPEEVSELRCSGIVFNRSDTLGKTGNPSSLIDRTSSLSQSREACLTMSECTHEEQKMVDVSEDMVFDQRADFELGCPGITELSSSERIEGHYVEFEEPQSAAQNGETPQILSSSSVSSSECTEQQQQATISRNISVGPLESNQLFKHDLDKSVQCNNPTGKANLSETTSKVVQNVEEAPVLLVDFHSDCFQSHADAAGQKLLDSSEKTVYSHVEVEEKNAGLDENVTELTSQKLKIKEVPCIVSEEVSTTAYDRATEISASLQLAHLQDAFNVRSNGHINSNSISSSRKRITRSSQIVQTNETQKTSKQQAKSSARSKRVSRETLEPLLKMTKKKRSCPCKPARSSIWGELRNIVSGFSLSNAVLKHDSPNFPVDSSRESKFRSTRQSRGQKTQAYGTVNCQPRTSSGKFTTKVKMAKKKSKKKFFYLSDTTDSSASDTTDFSEDEFLPEDHIGVEGCNVSKHNMRDDAHRNWEKRATSLFTSNRDPSGDHNISKETVAQHHKIGNSLGDCPSDSVVLKSKVFEQEAVNNQYSDQGTSPDSEVIDVIQDIADGILVKKDLHDVIALSSAVGLVGSTTSTVGLKSSKKGNKLGNANHVSPRHGLTGALGCNSSEYFDLTVKENSFSSSSIVVGLPYTPSAKSKILNAEEPCKSENSECINPFAVSDIGVKKIELVSTEGLSVAFNDLQTSKASMSCPETSMQRLSTPNLSTHMVRGTHERKLDDKKKAVYRRKPKDRVSMVQVVSCVDDNLEKDKDIHFSSQAGNLLESKVPDELPTVNFPGFDTFDSKKSSSSGTLLSDEISSTTLTEFNNQNLAPRKAWVLCDDCSKWRSISALLADSIDETNCKWTCKENSDTTFADCSIPQEKTNSEINAELDISDASGDEDALAKRISSNSECKSLTVFEQSSWKPIKSNLFLHRSRKSTPDDEIMVCQCTPPRDGGLGCGDECLNRMLNIECVRGTCPCGDQCSNQQFQKRKYAKLNYFRCGRKGHGLQVLERVFPGKFLIEYVGEVLDMTAYGERQREYAFRGQKHFYFMTLTATEVIDACAKGNLGRFINHSCDPNCRTEKWMVNGEVCIGLFALRSIKEGEELTFDYNYQRVFGAAAKKCICGAPECRGYLGGDPLNTEIVVESESDDEYPEPLMVLEARDDSFQKAIVQSVESKILTPLCIVPPELPLLTLHTEDTMAKDLSLIKIPESLPTDDIIGDMMLSEQPLEVSPSNDELMNKSFSIIPYSSTSDHTDAMTKSLSHLVTAKNNLLSSYADSKSTLPRKRPLKKSLRLSNSVKKTRISPVKAIKPWVHVTTPKKIVEEVVGSRFEGVEEKLSEFLGTDGGISRRKGQDAIKGYLKLLFVTATSGDNINTESMQRTRDLSILLDALLKTKSRTVLADLISKNGLQILHNLIKQNRKIFNRTPIIRKLLKVFEFLAQEGILTSDHINCPPRTEAESFAESILELTSHTDVPVHSSARTFRDRWISQAVRRLIYLKKDDNFILEQPQINSSSKHLSPAFRSLNQGLQPTTPHLDANGTTTRKRKSRWDQPADVIMHPHSYEGIECQKMPKTRIEASPCAHKDAPPGFSCSHETPPVAVANNLVTGCPQESYISDKPMSYGIPLSFVNQLGCEADITNSWLVAPAIPFHSFPPLPSVPRYTSPADGPHQMETSHPSTSESTQVLQEAVANSASNNQPAAESNIGRRYFRQQKLNNNNWNNIPPWCRRRNWEGYKGNNSFRDQNVGYVPNNFRGSFGRGRGQYFNSNFYQQPRYYR